MKSNNTQRHVAEITQMYQVQVKH